MINSIQSDFINDPTSKKIMSLLNKEGDLKKCVISSSKMIELSQQAFDNKIFEDLAYVEPMYVKKPYVN